MSQDQLDRLRRLRAARGEGPTRLESGRDGQPGTWADTLTTQSAAGGHLGGLIGLLILVGVALAAIGGVAYALKQFHSSSGGPYRTVTFVVAPDEGVSTIADQLQKDNLVNSSLFFRLYYQFNGSPSLIQAGPHRLNTNMSMDDLAKAIQSAPIKVAPPPPSANQYNILPGKRAEEIAAILEKYHIASASSVLHEIRQGSYNYWFLKGLPPGTSLEGYLAPGEYTFLPHSNPHSVVALMLRRFGQEFTPAMVSQAKRNHQSVYAIVTLASIIQRESSFPKVQKAIAGVFFNRLKPESAAVTAGKLNSDPTVQYALGYSDTEHTWWRKNLTSQDIANTESPYNTYLHPGLPLGPISNPGKLALNAALNPAPSKWLFFQVLTRDGKNAHTYFCSTYQCHLNQAGVAIQ